MYEVPSPAHRYLPVVAVFWGYVLVCVAVTAVLAMLGLPDTLLVYAFGLVALALLGAFVPLFRRFTPAMPHGQSDEGSVERSNGRSNERSDGRSNEN